MGGLDGLRRAVGVDAPLIEQLVIAAYSGYIDRIGMKPNPMLDDYSVLIAGDEVWVLGSDPLDAVLVLVDRGAFLLIDNVAVRPDQQGRGLGGLLVRFAERRALESGLAEVRLYTNELMTENRARYAKWGYREVGRVSVNGRHGVLMNKTLGRDRGAGT